eukprot:6465802-Amphidinium_carterae.3
MLPPLSVTGTSVNGNEEVDCGVLAHMMSHLVQQHSGEWMYKSSAQLAASCGQWSNTFAVGHVQPHFEFISGQAGCATHLDSTPTISPLVSDYTHNRQVPPDEVNDKITILTLNALSLAGRLEESPAVHATTDDGMASQGPPPLCQAGQLVYLCKRLQQESVDIACIQESRLALPDDFSVGDYWVIQNAASRGVGGILILVAKGSNNKILRHRAIGSRVLHSTVRCKGINVFVVAAHAPIQKSPAEVHEEFAQHLRSALACKPQGAILLGGADLNTRMGVLPEGITIAGQLASVCPKKAYHAKGLLDCLQEFQVSLVNTFIDSSSAHHPESESIEQDSDTSPAMQNANLTQAQHDAIATWFHPRSKKTFQI